MTVNELADEYNIHPTTVRRIRGIGMTVTHLADQGVQMRKKKKLRRPANEDLEKRLYVWFLERRALGDVITDSLIKKKALELNKEFEGSSDFKASLGWLSRFKERHDIRLLHPGKRGCTNVVAEKEFTPDFEFLNYGHARSNFSGEEVEEGLRRSKRVKEEPVEGQYEEEEEVSEGQYEGDEANGTQSEEEEPCVGRYEEEERREENNEEDNSQREIEQALDVLTKHTEEAPFIIKSTLEVLRDFLLGRKT